MYDCRTFKRLAAKGDQFNCCNVSTNRPKLMAEPSYVLKNSNFFIYSCGLILFNQKCTVFNAAGKMDKMGWASNLRSLA